MNELRSSTQSREYISPVVPKMVELIEQVIYSDIWERPNLGKRERSLITIAVLIALRQTDQLRSHLERGMANGLTPDEISEAITHIAIYSGFPAANSAARVARPLFEELGVLFKEKR